MIELYTVNTANGQKAQVALQEAGVPYRTHLLDLKAGDQRSPDFAALSPFGQAPALVDPEGPGGAPITLAETFAIAWYAAKKGGGDLLPRSEREEAEAMMWAAAISSSTAVPFTLNFIATVMAPEPTPWLTERATASCRKALAAFETRMADRPYLGGERFTVLDCLLYPVVATSAKRLEGWLEPYPNLKRYEALVGARPAVQRGMADVAAG